MSRFFENRNPIDPTNDNIMEASRVFDVRDPKWGHPALLEPWDVSEYSTAYLCSPNFPLEEKIKASEEAEAFWSKGYLTEAGESEAESLVSHDIYTVPGCPEEPDTEVTVHVYRPLGLTKKKARAMFFCLSGGLVLVAPAMQPIEEMAVRHNCSVIVPIYRKSFEAQYPAAINDLHAGYKWMVDNAEMLQINPDNVVITGHSAGGHLAAALPFRLKRYGYRPKGVVVTVPQMDDRESGAITDHVYNGAWDAHTKHYTMLQYLGINFASDRVGPEAVANHATVEECVGYPPMFIHTAEFDPDRNNCREFYYKLTEAKTYTELHSWGGCTHASPIFNGSVAKGEENEYSARVNVVVNANIEDCFKYDLRRSWLVEE